MAKNDVILLDSILRKRSDAFGPERSDDKVFEFFSFEQLLNDYDLSYEEIQEGWVDGGDDGGIDGFFVMLNGRLTNALSPNEYKPTTPIPLFQGQWKKPKKPKS